LDGALNVARPSRHQHYGQFRMAVARPDGNFARFARGGAPRTSIGRQLLSQCFSPTSPLWDVWQMFARMSSRSDVNWPCGVTLAVGSVAHFSSPGPSTGVPLQGFLARVSFLADGAASTRIQAYASADTWDQ